MIHPLLSLRARGQTLILRCFPHTIYGRRMKKLHDTHLGESCFVIGNGPSLTARDLTALHERGIDTFAANRIYRIFPQTPWRPTYYVNSDPVLIRDESAQVAAVPARIKFLPLQNRYYHGIAVPGACYFFRNDRRENDQPGGFGLDCTAQVNILGTVTIDSIQLAVHMGYRNIYLLGVDHRFDRVIAENGAVVVDPTVKNYFVDDYDTDVASEVVHDLGNTTRAYRALRRFADANGIRIRNASRASALDAFVRIRFEEALAEIEAERQH